MHGASGRKRSATCWGRPRAEQGRATQADGWLQPWVPPPPLCRPLRIRSFCRFLSMDRCCVIVTDRSAFWLRCDMLLDSVCGWCFRMMCVPLSVAHQSPCAARVMAGLITRPAVHARVAHMLALSPVARPVGFGPSSAWHGMRAPRTTAQDDYAWPNHHAMACAR